METKTTRTGEKDGATANVFAIIAPHCEFRQSGDKCGTPHNVAGDYTRIPPESRHRALPFIATGLLRLM